jgi:hypothetical protein
MHVLIQEGALVLYIFLLLQLGDDRKVGEDQNFKQKSLVWWSDARMFVVNVTSIFPQSIVCCWWLNYFGCCRTTPPAAIAKES